MSNRPSIPAEITRQLLIESGHRCAVCGAGCPLERAHIIPWHKSKEHKAEDLICLCATCHERADLEGWGEKALREYKQKPWILRQYSDRTVISPPTRKIEVIIQMELSEFDEQNQRLLQYAIASFLAISPHDVRIASFEETNSIKVIIELPSRFADKLLNAYKRGNPDLQEFLDSFQILDISSTALSVETINPIISGRYEDKAITCVNCGQLFMFSAGEQQFFQERGMSEPKMCKPCRQARKVEQGFGGPGQRRGGGGRGGPYNRY